jgi:protein-tyrosine phosphatase
MTYSRVVAVDGAINFRDMGGYETSDGEQTRWRVLFRSGQLDKLTEQGCEQLRELQIKTLVDLRFAPELELHPTNLAGFVDPEIITWHENQGENRERASWRDGLASNDAGIVAQIMMQNYPITLYTHKNVYRLMLERIAANGGPLLFHCAAGKDRTGVGAALILGLLNIPRETIIQDYLLTQNELSNKLANWVAGGAVLQEQYSMFQQMLEQVPFELVKPIFDASPQYIQHLIDYVEAEYGSFYQFAKKRLELSDAVINKIRMQLLSR